MYWPVCLLANRALSPLAGARQNMADNRAVFSGRVHVQASGLGPWFCHDSLGNNHVASSPCKCVGLQIKLDSLIKWEKSSPIGMALFHSWPGLNRC